MEWKPDTVSPKKHNVVAVDTIIARSPADITVQVPEWWTELLEESGNITRQVHGEEVWHSGTAWKSLGWSEEKQSYDGLTVSPPIRTSCLHAENASQHLR